MKKRKTLNRVVLHPMLKHQPNTSPSAMFENSVLKPYSMRVLSLSKAFVINKNKQITPEEFNQELDNIMEKYKYESTEKDESKGDVCKLFPKIGRNYYRKQKEDIQKNRAKYSNENTIYGNPFHRGCRSNCKSVLCKRRKVPLILSRNKNMLPLLKLDESSKGLMDNSNNRSILSSNVKNLLYSKKSSSLVTAVSNIYYGKYN